MELSKNQKFFFLFLLLLTLVCSALHLHGYSMPEWHNQIDHSKPTEIIYGKSRDIRSDDWVLDIPLMLAQTAHNPKFPKINNNIGLGTNMMVPFNIPVWNSSLIFRPGTWGFLIGNDFGISWLWWTKYLGLLASLYLVLWILTQNSTWSLLGSLIFLYSPHAQFWTLHNYEAVIHSACAFSALVFLLLSKNKLTLIVSGLFFGWSTVCFAIDNIYPPFQVVCGLFFLVLTIIFFLQRGKNAFDSNHLNLRIFSFALGLLIILFGALQFYADAKDAILAITNTTYPGRRVSKGGGFPFFMLFAQNLLVSKGTVMNWVQLGNYCEAANFIFFFPVIAAYFFISRKTIPWKENLIPISCLLFILIMIVYTYIGFPLWLAEITLLSKATDNRTQIGMGLAEICLLICILKRPYSVSWKRKRKTIVIFSFIFLSFFAFYFTRHVALSHKVILLIPLSVYGFLSFLLFTKDYQTKFLAAFLVLSILYTYHFNPIVRGGDKYLQNNEFGQMIKKIDAEYQHKSLWITFSDNQTFLTNYFRIIGVASLSGYSQTPQLALLKYFDPEEKHIKTYNQCAFINYTASESEKAEFHYGSGTGVIKISPKAPAFRQLGVTHFLFNGPTPESVKSSQEFELVGAFQDKEIYKLLPKI